MLIVYPVTQSMAQLSVSDTHLSESVSVRDKKEVKQYLRFQTTIQIFSYAMVFIKQHPI